MRSRFPGDPGVDGQVVLFARQGGRPEIDELRAEQADTLGAEGHGHVHFFRQLDVGQEVRPDLVQSYGFEAGRFLQLAAVVIVPLLLGLILATDGGRRVDDDFAARAVDDDKIPLPDLPRDTPEAQDGRDAHGTGQDGRVRRPPSHVERDAQSGLAAQPDGRLGRKEFMGDQDVLPLGRLFFFSRRTSRFL